jgi:NADH-quinone oxidoreductase subunit L
MDSSIAFYLCVIPALPLLAAVVVALLGAKLLKEQSHLPVAIALAGSFLCSLLLVLDIQHAQSAPASTLEPQALESVGGFEQIVTLWTWADIPQAYEQPPRDTTAADAPHTWHDFRIDVSLRADPLTAMMLAMVTFVATLVTIFASGYMHGEAGYWRFFAYIGLFVFSMTMLVAVSNFVLLFVFWEAVGVCSYLLIGFWYHKPEAAAAGQKAFLVNRVGDFGFALALFLIWTNYGTLNYHDTLSNGSTDVVAIQEATNAASARALAESDAPHLVPGVLGRARMASGDYVTGPLATAICLLLMLGACGKSAQFPLHVWLPDAMEGPTPVSALIHAATMVTAGVYMVTRCTPLFMVSPDAQLVVACIGGGTALLAGLIALTQHDLKRVLAYSTVSQLGFMFLGLGTGLFSGITAGMFHLFTHAFFKALLFLGSGSVMHAMHHIIDMRRFSGLRRIMPHTHWTFLVGCLALAGIPPLSGFWSKDAILGALHDKAHHLQHAAAGHHASHDAGHANSEEHAAVEGSSSILKKPTPAQHDTDPSHAALAHAAPARAARNGAIYQALYYMALFTAFLTAFYTFRAYFLTFHGEEIVPHEAGDHAHESPSNMTGPLAVLAVCAVLAGGMFLYQNLQENRFADYIGHAPSLSGPMVAATKGPGKFHLDVAFTSLAISSAGFLLAMYLYMGDRSDARAWQRFFDLQLTRSLSDAQWVAALRRNSLFAVGQRGLRSVGLGFLAEAMLGLLWCVAFVLSIPFTLGTFVTPYRLSLGKFFFDELYVWFVVRPLELVGELLAWLDRHGVDALVNLCGWLPARLGSTLRALQVGIVQFYALAMLLGLAVMLAAGVLWAAK